MRLWINEYKVPPELLALLDVPEIPSELWKEIIKARDEVNTNGAVTYPTKEGVEYYMHQYNDLLATLLSPESDTNEEIHDVKG